MTDDLLDLDLGSVPRPSEMPDVRLLGRPTVNARQVRSTKPLELVAAVALAGGRYSRDGLVSGIYGGEASDSALPTLAYRARLLGLPVEYDPYTGFYALTSAISLDVVDVLRLSAAGRASDALCLYRGPFLPRSGSPFAATLRAEIDNAVAQAALATGDQRVIEYAARAVLHPMLADAVRRARPDVASTVLGAAYLRGIGATS